MPFQNSSLNMVMIANPPKLPTQYSKGVTLDAYLIQLVDALVAAFPNRSADIRARTHDLKRRFAVMAKKQYPDFRVPADALHYLVPPKGAGPGRFVLIPAELAVRYSIKQQPGMRAAVARVMGIEDKGHKKHGSNFDSPQTLKQIIDNLFETVSSAQAAEVAERLVRRYGYDPR
ncbi:MAG TPA: hypothetical protein VFS20_09555 [Longimicrobium sp.]|nr:hypothetical protein [Longimicrobium sp.]